MLVWWWKKKENRHSNLKQPERTTKTVATFAPSRPQSYCYSKHVRDITKYQLNVVGQIIDKGFRKCPHKFQLSEIFNFHDNISYIQITPVETRCKYSYFFVSSQTTSYMYVCIIFPHPRAICHVMSMVWDRHHNYEYEETFAKLQKILPIKILHT